MTAEPRTAHAALACLCLAMAACTPEPPLPAPTPPRPPTPPPFYAKELHDGAITLRAAAGTPDAALAAAAEVPVVLEIENATSGPLHVAWIDYQGGRRPSHDIPPGIAGEAYTFATHAFAVTDDAGRERGVFVAGASDGLVTIAADR